MVQVNEGVVLVDGEETISSCMFNMNLCVALEAKAYLLRINVIIPALLF